MGILSVIVAAISAYAFGAIWYMTMAKPWMADAGLTEEEVRRSDPVPYIVSFLCCVLVAGMMRHIFFTSNVTSVFEGALSGFGLGLFIATPWLATNYTFARRPRRLILIDGVYATAGCTIMGLILTLL